MKSWLMFLPIVAGLSAFTLKPPAYRVRQSVQTLFVPVSYPARILGIGVSTALRPPDAVDLLSPDAPRSVEQLRQQNTALIAQIANQQAQLRDLEQLSQQLRGLGDLRPHVELATVIAGPSDQRQTLTLATTGLSRVAAGMPVVVRFTFVGQIHSSGIAGESAKLLLPTDPQSKIEARFARAQPNANGGVDIVPLDVGIKPLVEGTTRGMVARLIPPREIENKLRVHDLVVLDKEKFPPFLGGVVIGRVTKITLPPRGAGHAEVEIAPPFEYTTLRDVMVVTK